MYSKYIFIYSKENKQKILNVIDIIDNEYIVKKKIPRTVGISVIAIRIVVTK